MILRNFIMILIVRFSYIAALITFSKNKKQSYPCFSQIISF